MLYLWIVQGRLNHEFFVKWISVFFCNQLYHKKLKIFHVFQTNHDQKKSCRKRKVFDLVTLEDWSQQREDKKKEKKRNLTFISFKEKKHTNLLLKTHIEAVLSKFTLLYCVLDLSPAIRANSSQPLSVLGGRVVEVRPQRVRQTN